MTNTYNLYSFCGNQQMKSEKNWAKRESINAKVSVNWLCNPLSVNQTLEFWFIGLWRFYISHSILCTEREQTIWHYFRSCNSKVETIVFNIHIFWSGHIRIFCSEYSFYCSRTYKMTELTDASILERCKNLRKLLEPWWTSADFPIEHDENQHSDGVDSVDSRILRWNGHNRLNWRPRNPNVRPHRSLRRRQ